VTSESVNPLCTGAELMLGSQLWKDLFQVLWIHLSALMKILIILVEKLFNENEIRLYFLLKCVLVVTLLLVLSRKIPK